MDVIHLHRFTGREEQLAMICGKTKLGPRNGKMNGIGYVYYYIIVLQQGALNRQDHDLILSKWKCKRGKRCCNLLGV
jgi:hypothetical protein